jgi:hypothetical protein
MVRHWAATITHIQLITGVLLYFQSPVTRYFWANFRKGVKDFDIGFFGIIHGVCMLSAIVLVTIGSAKSKRQQTDRKKFKTMLIWFSVALLIIFMAIPWPFSPFANRPYFR